MLVELIEHIDRSYEPVFEQVAPRPEELLPCEDLFSERARGFYKAADLVIDAIAANHNLYNAEMIPAALSLYRHAIELHLKSMRSVLVEKVSPDFRFGHNHNLVELWGPIENYLLSMGLVFEDGQLHYRVARIIEEFNDIDEYGDRFRYPDSRSPAARNWLGGNFLNLKFSAAEVDLLGFGFSGLVSLLMKADR